MPIISAGSHTSLINSHPIQKHHEISLSFTHLSPPILASGVNLNCPATNTAGLILIILEIIQRVIDVGVIRISTVHISCIV